MPTTKYALISKTSSFLHASSLRDSAHTHFMVSCHIIFPFFFSKTAIYLLTRTSLGAEIFTKRLEGGRDRRDGVEGEREGGREV